MLTAKVVLLHLLQASPLNFENDNLEIEQAYCLALNVYHEARGEPIAGQFAVAHTTLNRVEDPRYPNNVCDVVKQSRMQDENPHMPEINKCQFSWYCDGKPDKVYLTRNGKPNQVNIESFEIASIIALMALSGKSVDNTKGSTHYYNYKIVTPTWAKAFTPTITVGDHTYLRREEGTR